MMETDAEYWMRRYHEEKRSLINARNDLSDIINTWGGGGDEALPEGLYQAIDKVIGVIDSALRTRTDTV